MKKILSTTLSLSILLAALGLTSSEDIKDEEVYKIGFGSCLTEKREQPVWQAIKKEELNEFFFMGDNVYGDNEDTGLLDDMKTAYALQKIRFPEWLKEIKVNAIWDDHDYGKNDGGFEYPLKSESQELFLKFWNVPTDDPRWNREGIYFSEERNIFDLKVRLIGLDTRYHRSALGQKDKPYSPIEDTSKTMLGAIQWAWLINELNQEADLNIIVSSIQVLPTNHGFEKWENFPHERSKLLTQIKESKVPTILVSGDRHKAGIYKKDKIIEMTSSSMNKPLPYFITTVWDLLSKETDAHLIDEMYYPENYGTISIFKDGRIIIELKDLDASSIQSIEWK